MRERWERVPPIAVDVAFAVVLSAATQWELSVAEVVEGPEWAQRVTFLVATAAVALRRAAPLAAALVCSAGMAAQTVLGAADAVGGFLAFMIVTHAVGLRCDRGRAVVGLVGVLIGVHLYDLLFWAESSVADVVANAAIFVGIWALARGARRWRSRTETLRADAAAAVLEQEARTREAVRHERARIARELHDVVAHGISVMTLQAGAARQVLGSQPPSVITALLAVEDHGRRSLDDMHRLLGLLRRGTDPAVDPTVEGVSVDELVARTRASGLPVTVDVVGRPEDVAPSLALTVHRIVQEALTNALRHGARKDVEVRVDYGAEDVTVEVRDRGAAAGRSDGSGSGLGLIGMHERVAVFDGELTAGPAPDGGWTVRARLPRADVPA